MEILETVLGESCLIKRLLPHVLAYFGCKRDEIGRDFQLNAHVALKRSRLLLEPRVDNQTVGFDLEMKKDNLC